MTGLIAGHMLAQFPAGGDITFKDVNGNEFPLENGLIVGRRFNNRKL